MTARASQSPRWWQWATVLSLDAPLVVMTWQALLGRVFGAPLHTGHAFVVGTSVWLAYAADRWLEANRVRPRTLATPRHRFYREHRRAVAITWCILLAGDVAVALSTLSRREITAGFMLLTPAAAYVLSHQFLHRDRGWRPPKELCVAGLIAGGASLFVVAAPGVDMRAVILTAALFAVLCFTNVALISTWERTVDAEQGQTSLARQFPQTIPLLRLVPVALAGIAALAGIFLPFPNTVAHCVLGSALLLATIDRFQSRMGWQLSRVLADFVLLTPLLPLLQR